MNKPKEQINLQEAAYFQAAESYSIAVWANGKTIVKSRPMKKYIPSLEANGWHRIHRSFMVNPVFIKGILPDRCSLAMQNGKILPISRRLQNNVIKKLAK
jgi:two-component system, LytTR family, response regulator